MMTIAMEKVKGNGDVTNENTVGLDQSAVLENNKKWQQQPLVEDILA